MVYFEQHVVLPPETQERVDKTIQLLNAIYQQINELSRADTTVAIETMKYAQGALLAIEKTVANADPIVQRAGLFIQTMGNLSIAFALVLLLLVFLVVTNTVLCYLMWNKHSDQKCRCQRDETKKLI